MASGKQFRKGCERKDEQLREQAGWQAGNEAESPEECSICFTVFDETERRPRTLPCGHTFCTPCIAVLINVHHLTCPTCRALHYATSATHFPISYVTEALIKRLQGTLLLQGSGSPQGAEGTAKAGAFAQKPLHRSAAPISKNLQSLLLQEKKRLSAVLIKCQEVQLEMSNYHTQLTTWKDQHQEVEDLLNVLLQQNSQVKNLLQQEDTKVLKMKESGEQAEHEMLAMQEHLDASSTAQETGIAIDASGRSSVTAENWIQKWSEYFPSTQTLTNSRKMMQIQLCKEATKIGIIISGDSTPAPAAPGLMGNPASTIEARVQDQMQPSPTIKVEDLRSMDWRTKNLLEARRVYAVHRDEGGCRSSRISLEGGQLYLYSLLDQPPPPNAVTLQMGEVMAPSLPSLVFLDLSWPGSPPRRVQIRLYLDSPRGKQFLLLCTGEKGPSYRNTRLFETSSVGVPGECVRGGDYQYNNGNGGAPLVENLRQGHDYRSGKAGSVWAWKKEGPRAAQFAITTKDWDDDNVDTGVFGDVVRGLRMLRMATKHTNTTEVTVTDCGVVLFA